MTVYYSITFFLIGTILGSFFNVVGDRLPRNESIIAPRSHCPKCGHILTPIELIPIFSYLIQGGKCKNCKSKIPVIHPLFELLSGSLFTISYLVFGMNYELIIVLTFVSLLLIIFVSDIEYMIIPDEVLIVFGVSLLVEILLINGVKPFIDSIINGIISLTIMFLIKKLGDYIFKRESMGGGDIKLMFIFGMVLGYQESILSIFIGSIIGLPLAIMILHLKKNHEIPFGPLLSAGALIVLFTKINIPLIVSNM